MKAGKKRIISKSIRASRTWGCYRSRKRAERCLYGPNFLVYAITDATYVKRRKNGYDTGVVHPVRCSDATRFADFRPFENGSPRIYPYADKSSYGPKSGYRRMKDQRRDIAHTENRLDVVWLSESRTRHRSAKYRYMYVYRSVLSRDERFPKTIIIISFVRK